MQLAKFSTSSKCDVVRYLCTSLFDVGLGRQIDSGAAQQLKEAQVGDDSQKN